jgi:transposase-like protein
MRFSKFVIWQSLYFYFRFALSFREVAELMVSRGVDVHHTSIYRWVLKFAPILEKRFRRHKLPVSTSWKLDETYVKVSGKQKYLYRAVDKYGQTIDFLLRSTRCKKAAKAFFKKSVKASGAPSSVVVDGSKTNIGTVQDMNKNERKNNPITLRRDKFLNNLVEQDHRKIKRKMKISLNFQSNKSAKAILSGVEVMHMIFKGQSGYMQIFNQTPLQAFWNLAIY